jgi:hypothetical protein
MKSAWIILITFIIGFTPMMTDLRAPVSFAQDALASDPALKCCLLDHAIPNGTERFTKNSHLIAQNFIPIVVIAYEHDLNNHFTHYLPLYDLNRQKEYFLLI